MTVNHRKGVTYAFYLVLVQILKLLNPIHKRAMENFKYNITDETNFLITHIEDYIEKHKSWLKG